MAWLAAAPGNRVDSPAAQRQTPAMGLHRLAVEMKRLERRLKATDAEALKAGSLDAALRFQPAY